MPQAGVQLKAHRALQRSDNTAAGGRTPPLVFVWWTKAPARCLQPTEAMSTVPLPVGSPSEGNRVKVAEGLCAMGL